MNYQQLLEKLAQDLPERGINNIETYKMVMPNWFWIAGIVFGIIILIWILCLAIGPIYSVWASRKRGEAELAEANFAEQVAIAKATARLKSAEMHKKAEVVEAQGVAESMSVIGTALDKNDGYLQWQWIKSLNTKNNKVIYVPTEANLPVLEAGRRK